MMTTTIVEIMMMIGIIIMVKIIRKIMIKMMIMMIYHQGEGPRGLDTIRQVCRC